jgi:hypothetical protein
VSAPVDAVPLVAVLLVHPPLAVQELAFWELQESDEVPPLATVVGFAVRVTVGGGCPTVTVALAGAD